MKKVTPVMKLTSEFSFVKRAIGYAKDRYENDAEHSFQLAVVAWSTNQQYQLGLDEEKVMKYSLVHDLVELIAGDTDAFGDSTRIAQKTDNEANALKELEEQYAAFPEILTAIEGYEGKVDDEAKFVNIMDKVVGHNTIVHSGDDYYVRRKVTYAFWKERFLEKIQYESLPEKLRKLVDEEVAEVLTENADVFFVDIFSDLH